MCNVRVVVVVVKRFDSVTVTGFEAAYRGLGGVIRMDVVERRHHVHNVVNLELLHTDVHKHAVLVGITVDAKQGRITAIGGTDCGDQLRPARCCGGSGNRVDQPAGAKSFRLWKVWIIFVRQQIEMVAVINKFHPTGSIERVQPFDRRLIFWTKFSGFDRRSRRAGRIHCRIKQPQGGRGFATETTIDDQGISVKIGKTEVVQSLLNLCCIQYSGFRKNRSRTLGTVAPDDPDSG